MKKANDKSDEVQQDDRQTLKGVEQKDHTLEGRLDKLVDSMNQIRYLSIGILSIFAISFIFSQNSRISELEDQITETSQKVESLQLVFDKNFRGLIQEINEGFAQLGSPSFDRTASAIFSSDFPEDGMIHVVKKGETLGSIAKRYDSQLKWIIDANRIIDPSQIFVGKELFIPTEE